MPSKEKEGKGASTGMFAKIGRYFRDMRAELKKIVWPDKAQVKNNTILVLVTVLISAVFIGGFDAIVSVLVKLLFRVG